MTVSNVNFFHGEVNAVRCVIGGVSVNVSANHLRLFYQQAFVEKIDELVGREHLFKKSLLLIRAWTFFESPRYAPGESLLIYI